MDVNELLKQIEAEAGMQKTAAAEMSAEDPMVKLAQDLFAGGRLFARGFIAELQKVAAETKAEPSTGDASNDPSAFKSVAAKIQARHGMPGQPASNTIASSGTGGTTTKKTPGENPAVVYEAVKPNQKENPNPPERHGNVGG